MASTLKGDRIVIPASTSEPANADTGHIFYDSNSKLLAIHDGTAWSKIGALDGSSPGAAAPSGYYLAQNYPDLPSGWYWIKGNDMPAPLEMYVDMSEEGGGYDFYPIQNGTNVWTVFANAGGSNSPANDGIALGLDMWYPRSKYHWRAATNFVINELGETGDNYQRYFRVASQIYRVSPTATPPAQDGVSYVSYPMRDPNYYGTGAPDWRVPDGGRWWLSDSTFAEPNGDYLSWGYLSLTAPRVTWNVGTDYSSLGTYTLAEPYALANISFNDIGSSRHHATQGYYLVSTNAKP